MNSENSVPVHDRCMLVVSGSEKGIEYFEELAGSCSLSVIRARSAAEASGLVAKMPFDVITVNAPLADERGDAFAVRCT